MFTVVLIFHVIVSIGLVLVVLMQSSKGEGLAGTAFGGSLSGAVFGGRGAVSFLSKATTVLAVLFMVNCTALAFMSASKRPGGSVSTPTESVVTRQAQEERERMLQQQQLVPPSDSGVQIQVLPTKDAEGAQPQSGDDAGK